MESWTLQGDSYSFLRSAPRNVSLCHRDGTPNHVEIFDIINVTSQRSAISETTCLCDIFGDDCESPSLPSSPAAEPFVPSQTVVDGTAAASPLVDDLNDSSGSYHSAQAFSEGEEGFEDSRERLYSPQLQNELSEGIQPGESCSFGHSEFTEKSSLNIEPRSKSQVVQPSTASLEDPETAEITPSSGYNASASLSPEERLSSLSSYSLEKGCSPIVTNSEPDDTTTTTTTTTSTTTSEDRHSSPLQHSKTPSPSPDSVDRLSSPCVQTENLKSAAELRIAQGSPEPRSSYFNQHGGPSPVLTSDSNSPHFTESASDAEPIHSSPLPLPSGTELFCQSRETPVSPELINRSYTPDTQASSPFPELRRISLPDLFSRCSTPDIEDGSDSSKQISNLSTTERGTATPESQGARLSAEPASTSSTPAPRYTPPSPVVSIAQSPELVESSISSQLSPIAPSPGLLGAASPARLETRSPSPGVSHKLRLSPSPSEISSHVSSPAVSHSLSPSPGVLSNCSPTEQRFTSPSPEIRITASSPDLTRKEDSVIVHTPSASPFLEPHSASERSHTSSPHITGIFYSVVQPEERISPPFPELSHFSTTEPERTLVSPESGSPTPSCGSPALSDCKPQEFPPILGAIDSDAQPEITHQDRYQPSSPQQHYIQSPEQLYPTASGYYTDNPLQRSQAPSPVAQYPKQSCNQQSPTDFSAELKPEILNSQPPEFNSLKTVPEVASAGISKTQSPIDLATKSVSSSFNLDKSDISLFPEIKSRSPVVAAPSPVSTSSCIAVERVQSLLEQQIIESEVTSQETDPKDNSIIAALSEEKQVIYPTLDNKNNFPIKIKSVSPNLVYKENSSNPNLHRVTSKPLEDSLENQYHQTSENSSSLKSVKAPEHERRNPQTNIKCKNSEKLTEDMAHYVKRRRTPSPPITRFTPVHIIAPEKPYRQWQQSSRTPSKVVASSASGNLKKAVTNRESPNVSPVDNNSQDHWVKHGMQFETEREMQLEVDRETGRERLMDTEMERERQREEQLLEKGKGWQEEASYRGEQVELSFSARNRKAPASHRAARTSREPYQALPTVHSYSESLLDTKQQQQQQTLLRLPSQQETKGVASGRRLQPPALQNRKSVAGRVAANRHCQSSSSSMGSEFDDADNEVKWFSDLAFRSLSSPEVDYLDMYNSSHRSSTNISQQSTQESPAGIGAAWLAYADFKGSAPKLDSDGQSAKFSDGLDPSQRFELGSFECIDVAMERDDSRKVRRGVPKRQIQLKRKDNTDEEQDANSPRGITMESISVSPPRETLLRQHSTPAAMQECLSADCGAELDQHVERKSKLQKSASLDESFSKNKMATCLIKNVLFKKMQSVDKQAEDQAEDVSPAFEENSLDNSAASDGEYSKPDTNNLSSSLQSDTSSLSDGLFRRADSNRKDDAKPPKSSGGRWSNRPSSSNSSRSVNFSQTDSEESDFLSKDPNTLRSERRSELKLPLDTKESRSGMIQADDRKTWDRRESSDTANTTARTSEAMTAASSGQTAVTNRVQECDNTEGNKQVLQGDKSSHASKTEEIPPKATDKRKTAINVCLSPEAENKNLVSSPDTVYSDTERGGDTATDDKTNEETNGNNQCKAPIHKVRDVRRLVKNTYNLTFKASRAEMPSNADKKMTDKVDEDARVEFLTHPDNKIKKEMRREENEEKIEAEKIVKQKEETKDSMLLRSSPSFQTKGNLPSHPQPMQIEYKAVCWKEDKNKTPCSTKASEKQGDKPQTSSKHCTEVNKDSLKSSAANKQIYAAAAPQDGTNAKSCQRDGQMTTRACEQMVEIQKVVNSEDKPVAVKTERKPPMLGSLPKQPSKEREVSTAVVLIRDGSSKIKTSVSAAQEKPQNLQQNLAVSHLPGSAVPCSGGHSVSMLIKEKGYQADIGSVMGDNQNTGGAKKVACKHVNSLEIPLQTTASSDVGRSQPDKERTFPASSNVSKPVAVANNAFSAAKASKDMEMKSNPAVRERGKLKSSLLSSTQEQTPPIWKQKELNDFEAVKRQDPTFPPRSPAMRRFRPQPIEVKSVSKEVQKQDASSISKASNRAQTIEVKSVVKNSLKPVVPPKPSCKFKPADLGATPNEGQRPSAASSTLRLQGEDKPQTIVVSSPTIYRKIPSDSTSASNYTRKLSVSAVSSLKAPPCAAAEPAITALSNQPKAPSEVETLIDRGQLQEPAAPSCSSNHTQKPMTIAKTTTSSTGPTLTSASGSTSVQETNVAPGSIPSQVSQLSQPPVLDPKYERQYARMARPNEQSIPAPFNTGKPAAPSTAQISGYSHPPYHRSFSGERSQRMNHLHFYTSDDPPSYDERESFSPLMPDLTPRRSNRYQPSSHPPLPSCSCTAGFPSHSGPTPPRHHHSPHNLTPPAPSHSPGQAMPYPLSQPLVQPHRCRSDPQQMSYQPSSPKTNPVGSSQPSANYQPIHQAPPCPPHSSLVQTCSAERPLQPAQHLDSRRPPVRQSPQPPGMTGASYCDPGHSYSPGLPPMDPQYLCGPQSLGASYGSEYGGDGSSLYSESNYGQAPRRVLLDPETGKYFYIEVPVQPLRKMLFDPETGQYVEVLIPHQSVSHSGLYPPTAAPYPPLHNPNVYGPPQQYMPYAAPAPPPPHPPPPAHPHAQPQPPRYPEASAPATMHQSGSYRNTSGQASKPDTQSHPAMDQSYLESMYYVPTGMTASPNPTPPDYYHKHPPSLPPTGGKRS
ncbi:uncharacterized protein LOC142898586 [Nelusetta ayraudi]|uniref:uncharacterized protein LOC142898586 n=1 Tax=Nelusetta ayraudi TaxID=303726 RepID=UPI003F72E879